MARQLSPEDVARFHEEGFLHIPALLPESVLVDIEAAFARVFAKVETVAGDPANADAILAAARTAPGAHIIVPGNNGSRFTFQARAPADGGAALGTAGGPPPSMSSLSVRHVAWAGKEDGVLEAAGRHPALMSAAVQLLGGGAAIAAACGDKAPYVTQMINQAHFKEPRDGVAFPWHQDSMHRRVAFGDFVDVNGRGSYVQLIVAVEDTTPDAGPVRFLPRSNAAGHLNGTAGLDPATVDATGAVTPLLRRGDAVALGPYTIHGSDPNTSPHWRRTFVNGFAFPGAQRARDRVYCEEVPVTLDA
jgi:hypothetical protein